MNINFNTTCTGKACVVVEVDRCSKSECVDEKGCRIIYMGG